MTGMYWFREDLRLEDNPALAAFANAVDVAVFVFVIPDADDWSQGPTRMGPHRRRFMWESLMALDERLQALGHRLIVTQGAPSTEVIRLAGQYSCDVVYAQRAHTAEECAEANRVAQALALVEVEGATLVHPDDLPFDLVELPEMFTQFRKKVEQGGLKVRPEVQIPELPAAALERSCDGMVSASASESNVPDEAMKFQGGARAGQARLDHYFWGSRGLSAYKQTRNGMLGWEYSSKFSPWLAWGCLSPRSIYWAVRSYEAEVEANESTYWLIFELLWRDYFRFLAMQRGNRIWHRTGLKAAPRNPVTHHPLQWKSWCAGTTRSAFVNANMHELRLTGFMSNRGRQNVASYAVHDLGLDWRACAAWFEHWLIDFDPCSNTGNWLYVAGIGNDPRPQRTFDVDWQAERYDADGAFQRYWNRQGMARPCDPSLLG